MEQVKHHNILEFTRYEKEAFLETGRAACNWYTRNQNTNEHPWGGVGDSADRGRFIYEYYPGTKKCRGAGIWAQSLGIQALYSINLHERDWTFIESAKEAARYMLTLQYYNEADEATFGGFAEHIPGENFSGIRDAATGGMGSASLFLINKEEKYLNSLLNVIEWYRHQASEKDGWPYRFYWFDKRQTEQKGKGDWQTGGTLMYYYAAKLTGDKKYIDDYLLPVMDQLCELYENCDSSVCESGFHGEGNPVMYGNDDFALIALMSAYWETRSERYLRVIEKRIEVLLEIQDPKSGMFPMSGGTFVSGLTMMVYLKMCETAGLAYDSRLIPALRLLAFEGQKLQYLGHDEIRMQGGYWGQSEFGVSRDRIHHRSTGYATIFYAMCVDQVTIPFYNIFGWEKTDVTE